MSPQISEEVLLLFISMYCGLVLVLCYDAMRIFRRIISASIYRVIAEDIIFWTIASIFMFDIFLKYNYGRPRFYAIGVTLGVMALFEWFIGRHIVDRLSGIFRKIIKTLLKPLKKILNVIKLKSKKLFRCVRKKVIKCPRKGVNDTHPQKKKSGRAERRHRRDRKQRRQEG